MPCVVSANASTNLSFFWINQQNTANRRLQSPNAWTRGFNEKSAISQQTSEKPAARKCCAPRHAVPRPVARHQSAHLIGPPAAGGMRKTRHQTTARAVAVGCVESSLRYRNALYFAFQTIALVTTMRRPFCRRDSVKERHPTDVPRLVAFVRSACG